MGLTDNHWLDYEELKFIEQQSEDMIEENKKLYEQGKSDALKNAVPLYKLCEWLSDNAYMYLTEKELDSGYSSHDPAYWEMKLKKWMEGQNG